MEASNLTVFAGEHSRQLPTEPGPRRQFRYGVPDPDPLIHFANQANRSTSVREYPFGGPLSE